jgi:hypothetical protein
MRRIIVLALLILTTMPMPLSSQARGPSGGAPASRDTVRALKRDALPRTVAIDVTEESNPLKEVASQLTAQFGIPVAYEEPAWIAPSELMRLVDSPSVRRKSHPTVVASLDPGLRTAAVGSLRILVTARPNEDDSQFLRDVLRELIGDHGRRGNPGVFKLVEMREYGYAIVPVNIRDSQDQWIPSSSPLDERISFPVSKRSLGATLELIASSISDVTGQKVRAETTTPGLNSIFSVATSTVGAQNEVARDVLARTLRELAVGDEAPPKMVWSLQYFVERTPKQPAYSLAFEVVLQKREDGGQEITTWPARKNPGNK